MCLCQTEWLTEDLLQQIQSNSELCRRLQDPTFMQAIAEFQANPQAAMQKYSDNAAMQTFFREFCGILGLLFMHLTLDYPVRYIMDIGLTKKFKKL